MRFTKQQFGLAKRKSYDNGYSEGYMAGKRSGLLAGAILAAIVTVGICKWDQVKASIDEYRHPTTAPSIQGATEEQ